jgi:hypothetical protein
MGRQSRWAVVAAVWLLAAIALAAGPIAKTELDFRLYRSAQPMPVRSFPRGQWSKLSVGMTRREVEALLGPPGRKGVASSTQAGLAKGDMVEMHEVAALECWEYGWSYDDTSSTSGACPYSHWVSFDQDGLLKSKDEPAERLPYCYRVFRMLAAGLRP